MPICRLCTFGAPPPLKLGLPNSASLKSLGSLALLWSLVNLGRMATERALSERDPQNAENFHPKFLEIKLDDPRVFSRDMMRRHKKSRRAKFESIPRSRFPVK
jgi:hypothetical protein